ncbi:Flavinator of succinate dehydrogenase-domain-containing protein [Pisolithus orientalis]|uniref:Flavinator of succinate dehydrogenase-domain-containing protein n=1 Tax=Pisolithus orientalis TaxID=936130 RepID=UPI002223F412|nr:Flavinator of succinate dehydrogenase-domain-containing protein [Pisolithus orientalis]KAI6019917.1 Flavinator of succinate dehydrogenase-domain-containing protein [Pisolithus orientalis]
MDRSESPPPARRRCPSYGCLQGHSHPVHAGGTTHGHSLTLPQHIASTTTPSDVAPPQPIPRPNESIDTTRARLVYQSRKRGTLESDLLLSTFARDHLHTMSMPELSEYDKLLDESDWDIYYWATGNRTPPDRWASSPLLQKLKLHAKNEGKVVRSMPPLS